jgi:hypothetical protein
LFVQTNPTFELALCIICELLHLRAQVSVLFIELPLPLCCCFCIMPIGIQTFELHLFGKYKVVFEVGRVSRIR